MSLDDQAEERIISSYSQLFLCVAFVLSAPPLVNFHIVRLTDIRNQIVPWLHKRSISHFNLNTLKS